MSPTRYQTAPRRNNALVHWIDYLSYSRPSIKASPLVLSPRIELSSEAYKTPASPPMLREQNYWWTVTGSNRSLRLAKPSCPLQHLQPNVILLYMPTAIAVNRNGCWYMDSFPAVAASLRIATSMLPRERRVLGICVLKMSSRHGFLLDFLRILVFQDCPNHSMCAGYIGGRYRTRTDHLRLAKPSLSQMS